MNALTKGLAVLAVVLVVLAAAGPAQAGHWRVQVGFSRPTVSYVPRTLPWRTGHVPISPVRRAYGAGYRAGYVDGFRAGVTAPVVVRRTIVPYGSVRSYGVVRPGSVSGRQIRSTGTILVIRW